MKREHIDDYFLRIVDVVGSRGTCDRGRSGCIIVKNKQILSVGYVGAPSGMPHCDDENHEMENNSCIRTVHAEMNAILSSAKRGVSINESTLYCTMFPCINCSKALVNSGIKRIVSDYDYHKSSKSKEMLDFLKIEYEIVHNKNKSYDK